MALGARRGKGQRVSILAILVAVGAVFAGVASSRAQSASGSRSPASFPDGGAFYKAFGADFTASGAPSWLNKNMAYVVAEIETNFGGSDALQKTNSYFNRHVGSAAGEWTGHAYTTSKGEVLRIYSDRRQCVRDFAQLISVSPIYQRAYAAMLRGDADGFFMGIVSGDGKTGYVGAYPSAKATGYLDGLRSRYAARGFA